MDSFIFINFDDERLYKFKAENFEILNETAIRVYGASDNYFFDEIQNVKGFEVFVRRLQDEGKKVVITGSNASLLSVELGSRLTGRYRLYELYPFSFSEYLRYIKYQIEKESFYITEKKVELTNLFSNWLDSGGLPEYLNYKDDEYVKTLFDNIIYRDIVVRFGIRKVHQLQDVIHLLVSNISLPITYNSMRKAGGLSNADTVREYIEYLKNSWMFFELHRYFHSVKQQLRHPKKIYIIDNAFNRLVGFNTSGNLGRRLENVVFLELRRLSSEIFYYNNDGECDFVIKMPDNSINLYQVCYSVTNENKDRELRGMYSAMQFFNTSNAYILTNSQEETLTYKSFEIKTIPVWKWMLTGVDSMSLN